jgi:hypothetical protein
MNLPNNVAHSLQYSLAGQMVDMATQIKTRKRARARARARAREEKQRKVKSAR